MHCHCHQRRNKWYFPLTMSENFGLPAHHTELWDHALELGILAPPTVIVSRVVGKAFLLTSTHPLTQGLASLSADKEAFCEALGQNHFKCDVFVCNKKHAISWLFYPQIFKNNICQILMHTTNWTDCSLNLIAFFGRANGVGGMGFHH